MGKKKKSKALPPENLTLAQETLAITLRTLRHSAEIVASQVTGATKYDSKIGSHNCYLATHAVQVVRELRQLEKHEQQIADSLTPKDLDDLIAEELDGMDPVRRTKIRERLDALDSAERLLS